MYFGDHIKLRRLKLLSQLLSFNYNEDDDNNNNSRSNNNNINIFCKFCFLAIHRYMYYSSLGDSLQIYRADMDGKNQMLLANLSHVGGDTFVDVALDKPNNRLFFSDQIHDVIRYINLTNMEIRTILSGNFHKPTSLALFKDTLFWTAKGDGTFSGVVFKANLKASSVTAETVADGFGTPKGILGYSMETEIPGRKAVKKVHFSCCRNKQNLKFSFTLHVNLKLVLLI